MHSKSLPKSLLLTFLSTFFVLSACSNVSPNYLREELTNEGPVALSKENPFIAANMFLALEQDASPLVKKFIAFRGEPDAVEVRHDWFGPMRIFFFYMDNREGYLFEERDVAWVIRGPEKMPFSVLDKLAGVVPGPPAIAERDAEAPPNQEIPLDDYLNEADPTVPAPPRDPRQESTRGPALKRATPKVKTEKPSTTRVPIKASRDIPRRSSNAEDTTGSDLSHAVRYPGETLRIISSWYTGSPENAGRIARINGIENPDMLYLGQQVRVPEYLIKTRTPFPEAEVERYIRELSKSP